MLSMQVMHAPMSMTLSMFVSWAAPSVHKDTCISKKQGSVSCTACTAVARWLSGSDAPKMDDMHYRM